MANRAVEIPGRLAGPVQAINVGPSLLQAVSAPSGASLQYTSQNLNGQNNTKGIQSFWMYAEGVSDYWRGQNSGGGIQAQITHLSVSQLFLNHDNAAFGTAFLFFNTVNPRTFIVLDQWVSYSISWDLTVGTGFGVRMAINGTFIPNSRFDTTTINFGEVVGWNSPTYDRMQFALGFTGYKAIHSIYTNDREALDFSVQSNIDKFIDTDRYTSVQLGPDGSNPTGNQPLHLFRPTASALLTNSGFERDLDTAVGVWSDANHNPFSPARFAHGTSTTNNSGLSVLNTALPLGDTQQITLSMWYRTPLTTTAGVLVIATDASASNRLVIDYDTAGLISVVARNSSGTVILDAVSTVGDIADNDWNHVAISINMQAATGADAIRIFLNRTSTAPTINTFVGSGTIDLSQTGLSLGFINSANHPTLTQGNYSQIWFDVDRFADFAVVAVLDLFVGFFLDLIPLDLGTDGSTPLTTAPLVLLGDAPTFIDTVQPHRFNRGTGADFTVDRDDWIAPDQNPARFYA